MPSTIPKRDYIKTAQLFHWATALHFIMWFTGLFKRHKRTEVILPRLVKKGKLTVAKYGKKNVYSVPRRNKKRINGKNYYPLFEHGIGCTEGLVRFFRADPNMIVIPERKLRGFGVVPEDLASISGLS